VNDDRDDAARIRWAFENGLDNTDLVIATGGLGPTADESPRPRRWPPRSAARSGFDEESAEHIRALFRFDQPHDAAEQSPPGAVPERRGDSRKPARHGARLTASRSIGRRQRLRRRHAGVPREMKPMMENTVLPWIKSLDESGLVYRSRSFQTFGASESGLDEMMKGSRRARGGPALVPRGVSQISVRVTAHGLPSEVDAKLAELGGRVRERIGSFVFGEGAATMEAVVGRLAAATAAGSSPAAESVTGGLVAERLTNVPGSSQVIRRAHRRLHVGIEAQRARREPQTLEHHGAVSEETAKEMAAARGACAAPTWPVSDDRNRGAGRPAPKRIRSARCNVGFAADGPLRRSALLAVGHARLDPSAGLANRAGFGSAATRSVTVPRSRC